MVAGAVLPLALLASLVSAVPATAADSVSNLTDRQKLVQLWTNGGPAVKSAAGAALIGNDEQILQYLADGHKVAEQLDLREAALKLVTEAGPGVSEAAAKALDGTPAELAAFMKDGWQQPLADDQRVEAALAIETGGAGVREVGNAAMRGSIEEIRAFLTEGQYKQRDDDARVRVTQIEATGGPATKRAAAEALRSGIEGVREFLVYGQHITAAQDREHATISDLAEQTKDAGIAAEKAKKTAEEQAEKAKTSARLAKEETAKAAAETAAAKKDALKAKDAARRAAESSRRAAAAAHTAISAAKAANAAAQAGAIAARNASEAALQASKATSRAWDATGSGKHNALAAAAADEAAGAASRIADSAEALRAVAINLQRTMQATLDTISDMYASADAATESANWARESGAEYGNALAAAAATRRHAAEAKRATGIAMANAAAAANAAGEAAVAARSAAGHARKAAEAARKAAEHAGDAQEAANRAKTAADEALKAAQTAGEAVKKAQDVQVTTRKTEAEEIASRTRTLVNEAKDAAETHNLAKAEVVRISQEAIKLDVDFMQLADQARQPGADLAHIATAGRKMALIAAQIRGPWSRAAAEAALAGDDAAVVTYASTDWKTAAEQDERDEVNTLALTGAYEDLRTAAAEALKGTPAQVRTFLTDGQYQAAAPDRRIEVARIAEAGGAGVKEEAKKALDSSDPKALDAFLTVGQHQARLEDDRVEAARLAEGGTPELKAAAETALASPDTNLRTFVESGQHRAKRRDQLNAAHVAQVQAIIASSSEIAARAFQDAYTAAENAANAQDDANAARNHAVTARSYADKAADWAEQAAESAQSARNSANAAAASAATARNAERQAADAVRRADNSAVQAGASFQAALGYAKDAMNAAEEARVAAVAAGQSRDSARNTYTKTVDRYMTDQYQKAVQERLRAEAEAKKKAIVKIAWTGIHIFRFLTTKQLPPGTPPGVHLDVMHFSLDVLGAIPVFGELADGINCGIYAIEGTVQYFHPIGREGAWVDAGLACAAMIPFAGWASTAVKFSRYAEKYGPDAKKLFDDIVAALKKAPGCPGKKNSFPAGTRVLMGDHTTKPIEHVRTGDMVQAADPITGESGPRRVEATIYTPDDRDFTDITLSAARGESVVTATDNHPFWSETTKTWIDAADLSAGDTLRTATGDTVEVGEVRHWKTLQPAYNLTVNDLHTYHVLAGKTPVLVHNTDPGCGLFPNTMPASLRGELALADRLGVTPSTVGSAAFDSAINSGRIKWAVREDGSLVIIPKFVNGQEISHSALTRGGPVRAAGEADIAGSSSDGYFGLDINFHSGHFLPSNESLQIGREAFAALGVYF
ncbi:polymorphic toxin-type HINT domain-containing protein [Streptomyces sp. bgisy126]|uniref:polymorphic toxin-type HINT domain-containing protein n=1 Tax=unclassified Streptomyces TaxID=2593676 RepID=UPI003EBA1106